MGGQAALHVYVMVPRQHPLDFQVTVGSGRGGRVLGMDCWGSHFTLIICISVRTAQ